MIDVSDGEWRTDSLSVMQEILTLETTGLTYRDIQALVDAGMVVTSRYYVPSFGDLYQIHRLVRDSADPALSIRWVMCRETFRALAQRAGRMVTVAPPRTPLLADVDRLDEPRRVSLVEPAEGQAAPPPRVMGWPVRFDPAARRPMIELVP